VSIHTFSLVHSGSELSNRIAVESDKKVTTQPDIDGYNEVL
jgi:hypothetical protein